MGVYSPLKRESVTGALIQCEQALCLVVPRSFFCDGPANFGDPVTVANAADKRPEIVVRLALFLVDCALHSGCDHVYVEECCDETLLLAETEDTSIRQSAVEMYRIWFLLGTGAMYTMSATMQERLEPKDPQTTAKRRKKEPGMRYIESMPAYKTALGVACSSPVAATLTFDIEETHAADEDEAIFAVALAGDDEAPPDSDDAHQPRLRLPASHALAALVPTFSDRDARRYGQVAHFQRDPTAYLKPTGIQFPAAVTRYRLVTPVPPSAAQLMVTQLPEYEMPTKVLRNHINAIEEAYNSSVELPAEHSELVALCLAEYGDPAVMGGIEAEAQQLNLTHVGERTCSELFRAQYVAASHIASYASVKHRQQLGCEFVDRLICRRLNSLFGAVGKDGVVETYAEARSATQRLIDDMDGNRLYETVMFDFTDAAAIAGKHNATHISAYTASLVRDGEITFHNCNLSRPQTFCTMFIYKCFGRLGAHKFGAQILVALLGGVGIGKTVILQFLEMFVPACLISTAGSASSSRLACLTTEMNKVIFSDDVKNNAENEHLDRKETSTMLLEHSRQVKNPLTGEWETKSYKFCRILGKVWSSNEVFTEQMLSRMLPIMFLTKSGAIGKTTADLVTAPINQARLAATAKYFRVCLGWTFRYHETEAVGAIDANYTLYYIFLSVMRHHFKREFGAGWRRHWFSSRMVRHMKDNAIASMAKRLTTNWYRLYRTGSEVERLQYFDVSSYMVAEDLYSTTYEISQACDTSTELQDLIAAFADAVDMHPGNLQPVIVRDNYMMTRIPIDPKECVNALKPLLTGKLDGGGLIEQFIRQLRTEPHEFGEPILSAATDGSKFIAVLKDAVLEAVTDTERKLMFALAEMFNRAFRPEDGTPPLRKAYVAFSEDAIVFDGDIKHMLLHPEDDEYSWGQTPRILRTITKTAATRTLTLMDMKPAKTFRITDDTGNTRLKATVSNCHDPATIPLMPPNAEPVGALMVEIKGRDTLMKTKFSIDESVVVNWTVLKKYVTQLATGNTGAERATPTRDLVDRAIRTMAGACDTQPGTALFTGLNFGGEAMLARILVHEHTEFGISIENPSRMCDAGEAVELFESADERIIASLLDDNNCLTLSHTSDLERRIAADHARVRRGGNVPARFSYDARKAVEMVI